MNEIRVPLSKKKLVFASIGSILFIFLGLQFIVNPERYISYLFKSKDLITIIGYISLLFFSLCLMFISYKFFDKKPGLIINDAGIIDNSNFASVGLIEWNEIKRIRTQQVMSNRFILIDVKNPEKYIQGNSKLKAHLMKASLKMYGTPISITSNSLKYNFEELERVLKVEFESKQTKNQN